jgi:tetratricopeptide (TPR) repeat protein
MKTLILVLSLLLIPLSLNAMESSNINNKQIMEQLQNDIKEIRRDQLNYKIENNLLKEAYSSSFTTVQIIISLILALFAILGYLGLKGIMNLKSEYDAELIKLKELKTRFELNLEKVKGSIETIDSVNGEQSKKIELLEVKEKVKTLYEEKNFYEALKYAEIGLKNEKDELELLIYRASSLSKLGIINEAIRAYEKILHLDPTITFSIQNLAELYLIAGQVEVYDKFIGENKSYFEGESNALVTYLNAFKFYLNGQKKEMKSLITQFIDSQKNYLHVAKNFVGTWDFSELHSYLSLKKNSEEKDILIAFSNYLNGFLIGQSLQNMVNG